MDLKHFLARPRQVQAGRRWTDGCPICEWTGVKVDGVTEGVLVLGLIKATDGPKDWERGGGEPEPRPPCSHNFPHFTSHRMGTCRLVLYHTSGLSTGMLVHRDEMRKDWWCSLSSCCDPFTFMTNR